MEEDECLAIGALDKLALTLLDNRRAAKDLRGLTSAILKSLGGLQRKGEKVRRREKERMR